MNHCNPTHPVTDIGSKLRAAGYNICPIFKIKLTAKPAIDSPKAAYKIEAHIIDVIFSGAFRNTLLTRN